LISRPFGFSLTKEYGLDGVVYRKLKHGKIKLAVETLDDFRLFFPDQPQYPQLRLAGA